MWAKALPDADKNHGRGSGETGDKASEGNKMSSKKRSTELNVLFPCLPDVEKAIGGVKQLYRHAEILDKLGFNAIVITEKKGFRPTWFDSKAKSKPASEIKEDKRFKEENTIVVLPETYAGAEQGNLCGLDVRNYKKIIFNQNAYYTTRGQSMENIDKFYNDPKVINVLAISEDTYEYLNAIIGIPDEKMSRIVNSVESYFLPDKDKQKMIHWMPRKNPGESAEIIKTLRKLKIVNGSQWRGEPLENMNHGEIAKKLNKSSIFLSFGSPEGFGLPVAEAMASGNWVVGYTGMGARELFKYGASKEIEFGDWTEFGKSISKVIENYELNARETTLKVRRQSKAIRHLYSKEEEELSISDAWFRILDTFNSCLKR